MIPVPPRGRSLPHDHHLAPGGNPPNVAGGLFGELK
jgi:hypothetical protein